MRAYGLGLDTARTDLHNFGRVSIASIGIQQGGAFLWRASIMIKHCAIRISGQVHGVSFRYYAKAQADALGLVGLVRNEPDGTVYIEAQGEEEGLRQLIAWCHQGPKYAQVSKVDAEFSGQFKNYPGFSIAFIE